MARITTNIASYKIMPAYDCQNKCVVYFRRNKVTYYTHLYYNYTCVPLLPSSIPVTGGDLFSWESNRRPVGK